MQYCKADVTSDPVGLYVHQIDNTWLTWLFTLLKVHIWCNSYPSAVFYNPLYILLICPHYIKITNDELSFTLFTNTNHTSSCSRHRKCMLYVVPQFTIVREQSASCPTATTHNT